MDKFIKSAFKGIQLKGFGEKYIIKTISEHGNRDTISGDRITLLDLAVIPKKRP